LFASGLVREISVLSLSRSQALVDKCLVDETEFGAVTGLERGGLLVGHPLRLFFHVDARHKAKICRVTFTIRTIEFVYHAACQPRDTTAFLRVIQLEIINGAVWYESRCSSGKCHRRSGKTKGTQAENEDGE
jgi:hypothetical protein